MKVGCALICIPFCLFTYDAYITVPVADLVGEPLRSCHAYESIPFSGDPGACKRLHQALYHERVRVIDTRNDQVQVELPSVLYKPYGSTACVSTFWTCKKYLIPVDSIQGDLTRLPHPISYKSWQQTPLPQHKTVTLTAPYHDRTTGLTFSAGTQFVRADDESPSGTYLVYVLNPKTYHIDTTTLPAHQCLAAGTYTQQERIDLCVDLIRSWIKQNEGFIPYVWGGTSVVRYTKKKGVLRQKKERTKTVRWYERVGEHERIKTGCDCSGLILRAAQICAIPYFFKNSYTATCYLQPLGVDEPIHTGDIIWVPGHVMIVADLTHNTLFEQRSYDHGYGKLHEIPLEKVFKDIKTWHDLKNAYHTKRPLRRIDSEGTVRDTFETFKILSLASVWRITY